MPCVDAGPTWEAIARDDARRAENHAKRIEAMLCGLTTALEKAGILDVLLKEYDAAEAGEPVSAFRKWWETHKAEDERRRAREARDAYTKAHATPFRNVLKPNIVR